MTKTDYILLKMKNKLREILNKNILIKQNTLNNIIENKVKYGSNDDLEKLNKLLNNLFDELGDE